MKTIDQKTLAQIFIQARSFSVECENFHNEKFASKTLGKQDLEFHLSQSRYYSGRLAFIDDTIKQVANKCELGADFLNACGIKS